jgi:hypothetical protein
MGELDCEGGNMNKYSTLDPRKVCFKHMFIKLPCGKCEEEHREISKGICPECHGEGEQGGQFCGGYWRCESCGGTGKYKI